MKHLLLFLIGAFIFFQAQAQMDFRKGYVITNDNDTLKGYVDYRTLEICSFKETPENKDHKTFMPGEIRGFGFEFNRWFVSKTVNANDNFFLEILVRGPASLYEYDDIFYLETQDTILPLKTKSKTTQMSNTTGKFKFREYIGIINFLLKDCPPDIRLLNRMKYRKESFIEIVEEYDQCVSGNYYTYRSTLPRTLKRYGVTAGYVCSVLRHVPYSWHNLYYLEGDQPEYSNSIMVGGTVNFTFTRLINNFSLLTGVYMMFSDFKVNQVLTDPTGIYAHPGDTIYVNGKIKIGELMLPVGFQYTFNKKTITPFINTGINFTIKIKNDTYGTAEIVREGIVDTHTDALYFFEYNIVRWWLGGGLEGTVSKKMNGFVEIRCESSGRCFYRDKLSFSRINLYLSLGIKF